MEVPRGIAEWFSRGVAVTLLILVPGLIGGWADARLGTAWLTPLGFLIGIVAGSAGLISLLVRQPSEARPADALKRNGAELSGAPKKSVAEERVER